MLKVKGKSQSRIVFTADKWIDNANIVVEQNCCIVSHPSGEYTIIEFGQNERVEFTNNNYVVKAEPNKDIYVLISFVTNKEDISGVINHNIALLQKSMEAIDSSTIRWNGYLKKILRDDMPEKYNRIAVKSIVTLISNRRAKRGDYYMKE